MASVEAVRRARAAVILPFAVAFVVGACSGVGGASSAGGGGGNAGAGHRRVRAAHEGRDPEDGRSRRGDHGAVPDQPGRPGCTWGWPSDTGTDNVSLQVVSPAARPTTTRPARSSSGLPAASNRSGAAASEAAPLSSSLAQGVGNLFATGDVSGLGDAAFMGPGQTLYVVKGDTEIQLQLLDVTDPEIMDKTPSSRRSSSADSRFSAIEVRPRTAPRDPRRVLAKTTAVLLPLLPLHHPRPR